MGERERGLTPGCREVREQRSSGSFLALLTCPSATAESEPERRKAGRDGERSSRFEEIFGEAGSSSVMSVLGLVEPH